MKTSCKELKLAIVFSCALHVVALEVFLAAGGKHSASVAAEEEGTQILLIHLNSDPVINTSEETESASRKSEADPTAIAAAPKRSEEAPPPQTIAEVDFARQPIQSSFSQKTSDETAIGKSDVPDPSTFRRTAPSNVTPIDRETGVETGPPLLTKPDKISDTDPPILLHVATQINHVSSETASLPAIARDENGARSSEKVRWIDDNSAVTYRKTRKPTYPARSRARGEQGTVLLQVRIDGNGRPKEIEVKESSGHRALDGAARASVRQWLFQPPRSGGVDVETTVEVPITFRLNNE